MGEGRDNLNEVWVGDNDYMLVWCPRLPLARVVEVAFWQQNHTNLQHGQGILLQGMQIPPPQAVVDSSSDIVDSLHHL